MKLKSPAGAVALEFALILPVFLLLLCGVIEFGIALYDKAVITNASREAARAGVAYRLDPLGNYSPLSPAEIQDVVNTYLLGNPTIPRASATAMTFRSPTQLTVSVVWNSWLFLFPEIIRWPITLTATTTMNLE
jgi:Flp pilus assembly protein TadG